MQERETHKTVTSIKNRILCTAAFNLRGAQIEDRNINFLELEKSIRLPWHCCQCCISCLTKACENAFSSN